MSPCVAAAKPHKYFSGMLCDMAGTLNQVGKNRTKSPALYCALLGLLVLQRFLPYHTQDIVGNQSEFQNEFVRLEFSGRKAFYIHIGL